VTNGNIYQAGRDMNIGDGAHRPRQ
jgi:hypothetical protein